MTVLVTDRGFAPDDWTMGFAHGSVLDLSSDTDPDKLPGDWDGIRLVRVAFPTAADGRGFTLARLIRLNGYNGRLRAAGHVISDHYAMARRAGFDEVEIPDDLAKRQPEAEWQFRANWKSHDYQSRLRG